MRSVRWSKREGMIPFLWFGDGLSAFIGNLCIFNDYRDCKGHQFIDHSAGIILLILRT